MMHNMQLREYLAKNPKKHLIFDYDETIARIEMDWSQYHPEMNKIYRQFDPSEKHPAFRKYISCNDFVREYGLEIVGLIKKATEEYELSHNHGLTPNPELVELIQNNTDYVMHVYSSNSRKSVVSGLKQLGILDKFDKIVTRDEVSFIKPDPDGFKLIYDPTVSKKDYLMVGNSNADQGMAEAAGIDFFLTEYFRPIS